MSLMSIHVSKRLTRLHNVLARLQSTIAFVWCDIGMVEYRIKEEDQDLWSRYNFLENARLYIGARIRETTIEY